MMISRIDAATARERARTREAVLVCAYDDEDRCLQLAVEGALSLAELRRREGQLSHAQELIFYCDSPQEATSARVAQEFRAKGFATVEAIDGGYDAWRAARLPV